jgi:HPt (histidine-containing phosphotransfer) domain-containing protein
MATKPEGPQPFDGAKLLEECDDEQSFANRCLHIFVKETDVDIRGITAALDRNDFSQIARLAHRIKGASASIRAEFLRQQAARLETLGINGDLVAAGECFVRLQAEFEHFKKFIAALPFFPD